MQSLATDFPSLLDLLVNLTILAGGLAAAYKFRVFDVMGHRYRSEVWCTSTPVGTREPGRFLFVGNFVIHNTGDRPLKITRVRLALKKPVGDGAIIDSERTTELVARDFGNDAGTSWFHIRAGERSIFPLRAYLDELPLDPSFFNVSFTGRTAAAVRIHLALRPATPHDVVERAYAGPAGLIRSLDIGDRRDAPGDMTPGSWAAVPSALQRLAILLHGPSANQREARAHMVTRDSSNRLLGNHD